MRYVSVTAEAFGPLAGETLVLLGNAPVCPKCDCLPRQKSE